MERTREDIKFDTDGKLTTNVGIAAPWEVAVPAGTVTQDASVITNPDTQIPASRPILVRDSRAGQLIRLCLAYDTTLASVTDPIVQVFGRYDANDPWERLRLRNNTVSSTLDIDLTNDVRDGTLSCTAVDPDLNVFDAAGKNEFIVGVTTALAGSTGTLDTAKVLFQMVSEVNVCCPAAGV